MDLWTELLALLSQVVTPIWNELIQYIPLLLFALLPLALGLIAWMWQRNAALNRSRVPRPVSGGPMPDGMHLPSPSIWPFIAPVGLFFVFASLVFGAEAGPNLLLLSIGLVVATLAALGWLWDARHEYDATEAGDHHLVLVAETEGYPVEQEIPEGIHLPNPSGWPFLAPIGLFFAFLGLALGPVMIVGGLVMAAIAAVGWTLDAGREYHEVADGAHADPAARDPERAFPKRLMPVYVAVAGMSVLLTLGPWMLSLLPRVDDGVASGPKPTTEPHISASSVMSFDQKEIAVPAGTAFVITFDNKQAGVPHNVAIYDSAARTIEYFVGDIITGPLSVEYPVDPLAKGTYLFVCSVHPPMTGTLTVQ
jgi:plastocyanin